MVNVYPQVKFTLSMAYEYQLYIIAIRFKFSGDVKVFWTLLILVYETLKSLSIGIRYDRSGGSPCQSGGCYCGYLIIITIHYTNRRYYQLCRVEQILLHNLLIISSNM